MKGTVKYNDHELVKLIMERTEKTWREATSEKLSEETQDLICELWRDGLISLIVEMT